MDTHIYNFIDIIFHKDKLTNLRQLFVFEIIETDLDIAMTNIAAKVLIPIERTAYLAVPPKGDGDGDVIVVGRPFEIKHTSESVIKLSSESWIRSE